MSSNILREMDASLRWHDGGRLSDVRCLHHLNGVRPSRGGGQVRHRQIFEQHAQRGGKPKRKELGLALRDHLPR